MRRLALVLRAGDRTDGAPLTRSRRMYQGRGWIEIVALSEAGPIVMTTGTSSPFTTPGGTCTST